MAENDKAIDCNKECLQFALERAKAVATVGGSMLAVWVTLAVLATFASP